MASGTKYTNKNDLLNALVNRVYTNTTFSTSSADIRLNDCDIVESLWDRGTTINELASFSDLENLISTNALDPGQLYSFPYQCIHTIPGTTVDNIDSPQYVEKIETFIVEALANNAVNPWVKSLEHPEDLILWDYSENTSESAGTDRSGKVVYREDKINQLSTFYDFRGVYFRSGSVDPLGSIPTWSTGQNWSRGSLAIFSTDTLKRAIRNWSPDNDGNSYRWQDVSPVSAGVQWVWKDNASYIDYWSIPRTNLVDRLTFTNCKNVHVGQTTQNNGYNNIIFLNCQNVSLGNGSYDAFFDSCNTVSIKGMCTNSIVGASQNCTLQSLQFSNFWSNTDCHLEDSESCAIVGCSDFTIGAGHYGCDWSWVKISSIGANSRSNSTHYMEHVKIGNNVNFNFFRNIQDTVMFDSIYNNVFVGIRWSTIKNDVSNCSFDAEANQYSVYEHVTVEDNCRNLSADISANVIKVVFGKGTNNIHVPNGANIIDTVFGIDNQDISLEGGCLIENVRTGSGCQNWTLTTGAQIVRTEFSTQNSNFTLSNSASIRDSKIGPQTRDFELSNGSTIRNCNISSGCVDFVLESNSYMQNCQFGAQCDNISIDDGGYLEDCIISSDTRNLLINTGANVARSNFGQGGQNMTISGGSFVRNTIFGAGYNFINIRNGCNFRDNVMGSNMQSKNFDGASNTAFYNTVFRMDDTSSRTFDNSTNIFGTVVPTSKGVASNILTQSMVSERYDVFEANNNADTAVNLSLMPGNKDFYWIIENTDAAAHDWTFTSTDGGGSRVVTVPASTAMYVKGRRVLMDGGAVDRLILTTESLA